MEGLSADIWYDILMHYLSPYDWVQCVLASRQFHLLTESEMERRLHQLAQERAAKNHTCLEVTSDARRCKRCFDLCNPNMAGGAQHLRQCPQPQEYLPEAPPKHCFRCGWTCVNCGFDCAVPWIIRTCINWSTPHHCPYRCIPNREALQHGVRVNRDFSYVTHCTYEGPIWKVTVHAMSCTAAQIQCLSCRTKLPVREWKSHFPDGQCIIK